MLSYIIWNGSPELFSIGSFSLRWYGLLFALGFLISQQILYYIFHKEGKPRTDVDILTIYMLIATLVGARLGHVIFYQPDMLWNNPLGVFLPFEFSPEFRFVGLQGLASHGGSIGILFALWLYSRKKKKGQNYLQILDRIVIVVAFTGALIRFGNFFNSEIIGQPTDANTGVVFAGRVTRAILLNNTPGNPVESIQVKKNTNLPATLNSRKNIYFLISFKPNTSKDLAGDYINTSLQFYLSMMHTYVELSDVSNGNLKYELQETPSGILTAKVNLLGVARHPSQLYESISSFLLFLLLFIIWSRKKEKTPTGLIFGIFMVVLWGLRFSYEFFKENQVPFENDLPLNMGQILSIPLFIAGVVVLFKVFKSTRPKVEGKT